MTVIYVCPTDKRLLCPWEGCANDIKQHFEEEHNALLFHTNAIEIHLNISQENRILNIQDEIYLIQSNVLPNKVSLKVRFLGTAQMAATKSYKITITINEVSYRFSNDYLTRNTEGWDVDLEALQKHHDKLETIVCNLFIEETNPKPKLRRKSTMLKINNNFVEQNSVDLMEDSFLEMLDFVDGRISSLKNNRNSVDLMDNISHLNMPILEEPFKHRIESVESYGQPSDISQILPKITEELNLNCTSCLMDMLPPIYLCETGHNVCTFCRLSPCKVCGSPITANRNTDLENTSRTHQHSCRYAKEGCRVTWLLYNEVRAHEAHCLFCTYRCQVEDCSFEGKFRGFLNHINVLHSRLKVCKVLTNPFPKNVEFYVVNEHKGVVFHCKSEQTADSITWRAVFCGPKERQYFCELIFKGAKVKEPVFLRKDGNVYEISKPIVELKKMKAKEKYAMLNITSFDC